MIGKNIYIRTVCLKIELVSAHFSVLPLRMPAVSLIESDGSRIFDDLHFNVR